jgi:hypothetical protein
MRQTITTFKGGDQLRSTVKVHERELERWVDELRRTQLGVGREVTMPSNESDWTVRKPPYSMCVGNHNLN